MKFRLRVRLKPSNDRGEFELDCARWNKNIAESSFALGHETDSMIQIELLKTVIYSSVIHLSNRHGPFQCGNPIYIFPIFMYVAWSYVLHILHVQTVLYPYSPSYILFRLNAFVGRCSLFMLYHLHDHLFTLGLNEILQKEL